MSGPEILQTASAKSLGFYAEYLVLPEIQEFVDRLHKLLRCEALAALILNYFHYGNG